MILIIPKVRNVDTLILENQLLEQIAFKFQKIIFYKNEQYVLLRQNEKYKMLRTRYEDGLLKLIEINNEELDNVKDYVDGLDFNIKMHYSNSSEEFWVTGICFNKSLNENCMDYEYKISSNERSLDILPYIVQTGAEHVFFSE